MIAGDEFAKQLALALQPFLKGQDDGVAHGLDTGGRRLAAAQPLGQRGCGIGKALRHELVVAVADETQWPALGHDAAGKGARGFGQIALGDLINDAVGKRCR